MDRVIVYPGQIPIDENLLYSNLYPYIGISKLAAALLGTSTQINAFTCTPTSPASLNVLVTPGEIYQLAAVDTTAYGTLPTNSHQILKQGILIDNTPSISCPAPSTVGNSINYLIQIGFAETDGGSTLLPYYNAANPSQAWSGPNNDALPQNSIRIDGVSITAKAGTSAPTGTQTTPSPDAGYVGVFVVTVAQGQTTITSGNISTLASAPFIDLSPSGIPGAIQTGQYIFAQDTSGSANTVTASISPAITTLTTGMVIYVKIANTNTGASVINLNALGNKNIQRIGGQALIGNELAAGRIATLMYDGTQFELVASANESMQAVTDTGSVNAYAVALTPVPGAYFTNMRFIAKLTNTNTSTSCTMNVNSLGTKNIKLTDGTNPAVGSLQSGGEYIFLYDGTNIQVLNPSASAAIQNNSYTYVADTGSANAYAIAPSPAIASYQTGQSFLVNIANSSVGWSLASLSIGTAGSYTVIPTLTFSGGGGTAAAATCLMGGLVPTAIANAGTGYHVNDTITLAGGTNTSPCILTVSTVSGTTITAVTVSQAGSYSVLPSNPVSQASTSGTGTSATFTMAWSIVNTNISNAGSGYITAPIVTVSAGTGAITATVTPTMTLNVSSLGTKNIINSYRKTPTAGQMQAGMLARLNYNGTSFILENPAPVADFLTVLTSGTNTYTTPTAAIALEVEMVGGGAGGTGNSTSGSITGTAATAGGITTFGTSLLTANGGAISVSTNWSNAAGGTASGGDINMTGGASQGGSQGVTGNQLAGGMGGNSFFGGAGVGSLDTAGTAANGYGSGGGGGGTTSSTNVSGAGGGAGGYCRKMISSPSATYTYTVGTAGTGNAGSSFAGGSGQSGVIIAKAKFQ